MFVIKVIVLVFAGFILYKSLRMIYEEVLESMERGLSFGEAMIQYFKED